MNLSKILKLNLLISCILLLCSCGNDTPKTDETSANSTNTEATENENPSYDPNRGEGKFKDVQVDEKLNSAMAETGNKVYDVKCAACHKLTDEKLVGPGWKGVTGKHTAPWIMNFITNTDEMLNKDPKAQALLEICLVRMPNQNLSDDEARNLYEFMRKNDGVK